MLAFFTITLHDDFALSLIYFARAFYQSCITAPNQDGLKDFQKFLKTMGGLPALEGSAWKEIPWWQLLIRTYSEAVLSVGTIWEPGH